MMNTQSFFEPASDQAPAQLIEHLSTQVDRFIAEEETTPELAGKTLAEIERLAIISTIRACKGNKAASARMLDISEKSIYNKMRRLKISNDDLTLGPNARL